MTSPNTDDRSNPDDATPRDELADLAADLVSIPTENPPGDERSCAEFVVEWFRERGVDARLVEEPSADRAQAVAWVGDAPAGQDSTPGGPDSTTLVLNGHLDVVPAGDPGQWSHDPFAGTVVDGRLYGRGSADMKTNLAVGMLALRDLAPAFEDGTTTDDGNGVAADRTTTDDGSTTLDGTLLFHAAMGEETGDPGTRTLIEAGYGGDCAVVLEPTDFRVGTSAKGVATVRVGVAGSAAHASQPDRATNAVDAARPVLAAIEEYDDRLREREDPLVGRAYATVTEFAAGTDANMAVVPERAELLLDRRILPDESYDEVEAEVEDLLAAVERESGGDEGRERESGGDEGRERVETDVELVQHYASAGIPADHALAERFRDLSAELAGASRDPWGLEAATDAREFVAAGMPAIIWGPGELAQAHTADESVDLGDAALGLEILKAGVRETLSDSV